MCFSDAQKVNCPAGAREAALGRVAGKTISNYFAAAAAKLCEAFSTSWKGRYRPFFILSDLGTTVNAFGGPCPLFPVFRPVSARRASQ